ncbi:hypothetical protein [Streptomyces sp. NPDC048720]|uniref:hypothetical protein n=1 Tax=Streptomyces sp. NPDC048720 TaxID=3365588 RepID=UPI0037117654
MLRISGGGRTRSPHRGGPDSRRLRLLALAGIVVAVVALPLAVASTGQVGDAAAPRRAGGRDAAGAAAGGDAKMPSAAPSRSPRVLGLGLATAARCGPELSSSDGVEAQTCVLTQGADTWARTYFRNATGEAMEPVLSMMGPGGRTVQIHCAAGSDDEPATCETPREHTRGAPDAYTAVTEFAVRGADEPLLLRSGSNSELTQGS